MAIGKKTKKTKKTKNRNKNFVSNELAVSNATELDRILEARKNKMSLVNPVVASIHRRTVRAVNNQIAKEFQFFDERGKAVKKEFADLQVRVQQLGIVLLGVPARIPGPVDAEAQSDWIDFLTHFKLSPRVRERLGAYC